MIFATSNDIFDSLLNIVAACKNLKGCFHAVFFS